MGRLDIWQPMRVVDPRETKIFEFAQTLAHDMYVVYV